LVTPLAPLAAPFIKQKQEERRCVSTSIRNKSNDNLARNEWNIHATVFQVSGGVPRRLKQIALAGNYHV
jgi:hypothetical protein